MQYLNFFTHFGGLIAVFWAKYFKKSKNDILRFLLCVIGFLVCVYVYVCWNRIPVREHYFQIEHFMTNDTTRHPYAHICLNMNYGSTIDKQLPRADKAFNSFILGTTSENLGKRRPFHSTFVKLVYLLGQDMYNELIDSCKTHGVDEDFSDLFYVSEMQSVDDGYMREDHTISINNKNAIIFGVNDDKIFNSELYNRLGCTIQKNSYYKKGDNWGKDYSSYAGILLTKSGGGDIDIPDKVNNGFPNVFKLKDISQSYYRIKVHSNTIDSIALYVDFVGAANFSKFEYEPNKMSMCSFGYFDFQRYPILSEVTFYVSFPETQNLQVIRCFFLTVLMTLLITFALKSLGSIVYDVYIRRKSKNNNK